MMKARIREYEYNVHRKLSEAGIDIVVEYDNEEDMWDQISAYMAQDSEFQEYANTLSVRDRLSFLWRLFVSDYGRLFLPDKDNTFEYELYEKELIHNLKLQQEFVESVRRSIRNFFEVDLFYIRYLHTFEDWIAKGLEDDEASFPYEMLRYIFRRLMQRGDYVQLCIEPLE